MKIKGFVRPCHKEACCALPHRDRRARRAAPIASNDPARASVTVSLTGTGAGRALTFDAGGVQRSTVELTPAWETSSPKGHNAGSAGIAFADPHNRGQAGGQIARNIRVLAAR